MLHALPRPRSAPLLAETTADAAYGELPDRIYAKLRDAMIRGRLAPGARLVEAELAVRFAVSRTPVREALARLVRESYVTASSTQRRTRFVVAPLDMDAVPELWGIIGALEGQAIQGVGTLRPADRTSLVQDLERVNAALEEAVSARPRDVDVVGDLMSGFHICFMERCAGPWLHGLYDSVRPHVQRYEWAYGTNANASYAPSITEHRGIIAAIAAGDGELAKHRLEQHWARGAKRTVSQIRRSTSRARR